MCVAIYKPAKEVLTKKVLHKCFKANGDGAGFSYLDPKSQEAVIIKGLFTFKDFWVAYREHMEKESIIHFRWATHGATEGTGMIDNCHPFPIPDGALIHNGVIHWATPHVGDVRSDTRIFTEDLLIPFVNEGMDLHSKSVKQCLEESIGVGNKMILFYKGKPIILNEKYGLWIDGVWFSNTSWKWDTNYIYSNTGYVAKPHAGSSQLYDDDGWYQRLEMQWERDEAKIQQAETKDRLHSYLEDSCGPCDDEEEYEEEEEDLSCTCDICSKVVVSDHHLVSINQTTRACMECWNCLGCWQSEVDAFDRANKPYMRRVYEKAACQTMKEYLEDRELGDA